MPITSFVQSTSQRLSEPVCIVDGHFGIYVPQAWAERYGQQAVDSAGVDTRDLRILLAGPDHPDYWDAWTDVLDAYCHEVDGVSHFLWQDGDLFEYPEDVAHFGWWDDDALDLNA